MTVLGDAMQRVKELTRLPSFIYHPHNLEEREAIGGKAVYFRIRVHVSQWSAIQLVTWKL
jgi:hypothetical protein